jgi:predicted AlkP superfamily phosphohydrolase/phosphomutase
VHVNSWLAENGFMSLTSTTEAQRKDNTLFSDVDWNNTQAYALGFGTIFLNLKGRDKHGIVSPDEARAVSQEIAQKLLELSDPLSGIKVVKQVYLRDEIYSGPYMSDAPDLVFGFRPGYRVSWQTAIGGAPWGLFADNFKSWSGDHCIDPEFVPGIIFLNRKLPATSPRIIDIAPTVLDVLGLAIPEEMDGKSLFGG